MMGGLGGPRHLMEQETSKPQKIGATLARFGFYFRKHWVGLGLALAMTAAGTWAQVKSPELIGQAVDCYLLPNPASCTYATVSADIGAAARLDGLTGLVLLLVALFVGGALLNGLAFYAMNWSGQHALRRIREDLFAQIHRLSLGFYARNEAGNIMSRITSDTDTIQQAMGFALLNVISGVLLVGWIMIKMLLADVPYALLSLSVFPVMAFATFYFSGQARKAFRRSRE